MNPAMAGLSDSTWLKAAVLRAAARLDGTLISGLFERIGSGRLCFLESICLKVRRYESCRQAGTGILIPGLFERIGNSLLCQNNRFTAAARLESLSRASLRESVAAGFAYLSIK